MAAVTISAAAIDPSTGVDLSAATYTTLVSGSGNGVTFTWNGQDLIILKNDTGGSLNFTVLLLTSTEATALGVGVSSKTYAISAGQSKLLRSHSLYNVNGNVTIECSGAGKVAVLN